MKDLSRNVTLFCDVYGNAASKFKVISTWEDEHGIKFENEQLRSL